MTDYKNLKLIASSSPHIRSNEDSRSIMLDVIIALLPALVMGVYVFGWGALGNVLVSVAACVFWEWGYRKVLKKPSSIGDLSAVVTGILLAFVCPANLPYWMLIIGDGIAIIFAKCIFGGLGKRAELRSVGFIELSVVQLDGHASFAADHQPGVKRVEEQSAEGLAGDIRGRFFRGGERHGERQTQKKGEQETDFFHENSSLMGDAGLSGTFSDGRRVGKSLHAFIMEQNDRAAPG